MLLFTDSTFNFHCCPVHIWLMLLIFSLALITGNKPLMPALQENPQLCDKGAYQNARNPGFPGSLSQLGVKRQKARDYAEMCASVSRGAEGKGEGLNCCFGSASSGFDIKLGYWISEHCLKMFDSACAICLNLNVSLDRKQSKTALNSPLWQSASFTRMLSVANMLALATACP